MAGVLWALAMAVSAAGLQAQGEGEQGGESRNTAEVRPALRRAVAVQVQALDSGGEWLPEIRGALGSASRWLAFRLAEAAAEPRERLALLEQIGSRLPADDVYSRSYTLYCRALVTWDTGDRAAYVSQLQACVAMGCPKSMVLALEALITWAIVTAEAERACAWLRHYEEVAGLAFQDSGAAASSFAVGKLRARVYLAFGMHRAASLEIDRLATMAESMAEPTKASAARAVVTAFRFEELAVGEQFDEFLADFDQFGDRSHPGLRHQRAFALSRTGQFAAAEAELLDLLQREQVGERRPMLLADLAMVRRALGADVAAIAATLGEDAEGPLEPLHDRSLAARARLDLDRWRAGALERGRLDNLRQALRQRLDRFLHNWRAMPEVSAGVAFLQWSVRRELLACLCLVEWAAAGSAAFPTCLEHALATDACGSLARRRKAEPLGVDAFLRLAVPADGVLCWFLPAPHGSVVLVASETAQQLIALPGDVPLRGWVAKLRQGCRDERQLGADGRAATAALTAPLEQWLFGGELAAVFAQHRRVTVLGRELLAGLPFEFLRSPTGPETWLGHSHAIDYLPSAALLADRATPSPSQAGRTALRLVAASRSDPAVAALYGDLRVPLTEADLEALVPPPHRRTARVDPALDGPGLQRACADSECLVVFAHGRRRHADQVPASALGQFQPVGLVLRDGFFGAERLQEPTHMPACVVLAACGAARAGVDRGEDGQLFSTAWLAAGSDFVVSAEGDLQVATTVRQVGHLLGELARGVDPAEALRRSRIATAAAPGCGHPALHCALRLDRARPGAALPNLATAGAAAPTEPGAPLLALLVVLPGGLAAAAWVLRRRRRHSAAARA